MNAFFICCSSLVFSNPHLARVADLANKGDQVGAARLFFYFRVADLAMGSGHFIIRACQYLAEEIATNPYAGDPIADNLKGDESALL